MKKEIDNIFVDVRNAFRLLSRYQKRILNIVNYIREQTPYTDMWGSKNWYSDEIKNRRNSPDKEYAKLNVFIYNILYSKIEEASKLLNGYCKAMLNSNFSNTLE